MTGRCLSQEHACQRSVKQKNSLVATFWKACSEGTQREWCVCQNLSTKGQVSKATRPSFISVRACLGALWKLAVCSGREMSSVSVGWVGFAEAARGCVGWKVCCGRIGTLGEISQAYKNCRGRFCGAYRAQSVHLPPKKTSSNGFLLESYKDSGVHSWIILQ